MRSLYFACPESRYDPRVTEPARSYQAILSDALQLPPDQQAQLLAALLHALDAEPPALDRDELERRDAELLDGRVRGLTLAEFECALRRPRDA